jgi:hypothetical protein
MREVKCESGHKCSLRAVKRVLGVSSTMDASGGEKEIIYGLAANQMLCVGHVA